MHLFNSAVPAPNELEEPSLWFIFNGHRLLVTPNGSSAAVPQTKHPETLGLNLLRYQYLGTFDDQNCYAAEVPAETEPPPGMDFLSLRRLFGQLDDDLIRIAGRSIHIIDWDRNNQFCGRCATPMELGNDRAKVCPNCKLRAYPRISPAVIMLVRKDNKLLLAHATRHPAGFHSVLAGFAEPGETLEECVAREIREEVNIEVKNIRYFGSQPWPFPDSLMIGFICEYASGEIQPDPDEIDHADWYTAAAVKNGDIYTPPADISIAGQLIQWFVENYG